MSLNNPPSPEFIQAPDGRYRIKNQRTGKLDPPWKHLTTQCGDDFERYVRTSDDCDEFPFHPTEYRDLEHKNLWPGRKLRICFGSGQTGSVWSEGRVASFREASGLLQSGDPTSWEKFWYMKVEFGDDLGPGVPVLLHSLQATKEHNGKLGVITAQLLDKGRFPVMLSLKGKTEEPGRQLAVLPGNLKQVATLECGLLRINVQGGGTMLDNSQSRERPLLSFEWMERVSEEKPWYLVYDPPEAPWRRPFTVDEKIEDLRTYRAEQVEDCLQHESEELVSEKLTEIKDHLIQSLQLLTRHGSMDGMREARRLLLTHPLAMVVLVMKELVSCGYYDEELHLFHAVVVAYFEIWKQTNGFQVVDFGPSECTVYALAEISDLIRLREWALTWWDDVVKRFRALKEYRATLEMYDEWEDVIGGDLSESEDVLELLVPVRRIFLEACSDLGDFESFIARFGSRANDPEFVKMKDSWTGSSGSLTPLVTPFEATYSPRRISDTLENCAVCGRQTEDPYWCNVCGEVPYCSKKCCQEHWSDGGHRRVCRLAVDTERLVKPCVVCGKASIVGCNRCIYTYYCSRECQMQHWYEGGHDKNCPRKPLPDP